ncbi:protein kinase domain-containing protein [Streptomyces beigongshangae]|uniref:serine/threonine-protein kinase n=1 Tax=Streptomyces beigongshangae TaxID=2841597 RepID=UPI003D314DF1
MGRVWRATDETLDRQVAVKEMRIDGMDQEDARTRRERTLREARATARIDHPNVVRVYDVVDEGERLWIVMELVDGRSLERVVAADGPLNPRDTAGIGLELVAALRQVHAGGVLHRDIKPGNVLVERRAGRVVLTDFGIAAIQDMEALTMAGMLVGSPDYMAPERISGRPQGPPSDLWSLGATLCAALGGRSPFSRATTLATLHAVLYEEPEIPSAAGELRDTLTALLRKDPAERPRLEELPSLLAPVANGGTGAATWPPAAPDEAEEPPTTALAPTPTPAGEGTGGTAEPVQDAVPGPAAPGAGNTSSEAPSGGTPEIPSEGATPGRALRAPGVRLKRPKPPQPQPQPRPETEPQSQPEPEPEPQPENEAPAEPPGPPPPPRAAAGAGLPTEPRPAPMPPGEPLGPVEPPAPRRAGSGTRDRTRKGLVAAVGVVVAGALAALLVPLPDGSSGGGGGASPGSRTSPPPTVAGTSRPPSLPAGSRVEAGMYAWVPPEDWDRVVRSGAQIHYTSPDTEQEILANASTARGDLMDQWERTETTTRKGLDYRLIRLEETTFRGRPAVVWEYTVTAKGRPWHVRLLGFDTDSRSYEISTWYNPAIEDRALPVYHEVRDSFTPL